MSLLNCDWHSSAPACYIIIISKEKPIYQNPTDIPSYDDIDIIEVAQVHVEPTNDSITSTDEFVPEVIDLGIPLNLENPTNHLS